jgi:hypothetical protein
MLDSGGSANLDALDLMDDSRGAMAAEVDVSVFHRRKPQAVEEALWFLSEEEAPSASAMQAFFLSASIPTLQQLGRKVSNSWIGSNSSKIGSKSATIEQKMATHTNIYIYIYIYEYIYIYIYVYI